MDGYELGSRILIARINKGLKQADIGKVLGISQAAVSKMELGKTDLSVSQLIKLSSILDVSIPWILGLDSDDLTPLEALELEHYRDYLIYRRRSKKNPS